MPKINAPTVAEHRAAQHRAILDAATRLIDESGGQVPTLNEVAVAVGLARSSMYQYVKSSTDLIVQLLLDVIPGWTSELDASMTAAGSDPAAQVAIYINSTFELLADEVHGPLMIAARSAPEAFAQPQVRAAHDALVPRLRTLLATMGGEPAAASLPMIDAAIQRGAGLVATGQADRAHTLTSLHRMAAGLTAA